MYVSFRAILACVFSQEPNLFTVITDANTRIVLGPSRISDFVKHTKARTELSEYDTSHIIGVNV